MEEILGTNNQLLHKFLEQFTPCSNNNIKNNHNLFNFVHPIIARIFLNEANIIVTPLQLAAHFSKQPYIILVQEGESGLPKDKNLQAKRKKKTTPFLDLPPYVYAYVNVSSAIIVKLKKASQSINYQKNPEKIAEIKLLKEKITAFFNNNTSFK